ncbi:hypothetical protein ACFQU7_21865 [Pseudoroseomonas wenyumeiae]
MPRRALPALAAALLGAPAARAQRLAADTATLLLPGPEGGPAALWAAKVAAGLVRGLPHAVALHSTTIGGPDGVTAANRFATLEGAEGRTLLVLPGSAAHARLIGESRARYPVEGWLPLCASWQGAILAGRGPMPAPNAARPLRLALPGPDAPEAAALLGLDLIGYPATPVFGMSALAAEQALARGSGCPGHCHPPPCCASPASASLPGGSWKRRAAATFPACRRWPRPRPRPARLRSPPPRPASRRCGCARRWCCQP